MSISRKHFKPSRYTQVCSDHFPDGNGRTWRHTVPTLFLPQKKLITKKQRITKNSTKKIERNPKDQAVDNAESCEPDPQFEHVIHSYARSQPQDDDTTYGQEKNGDTTDGQEKNSDTVNQTTSSKPVQCSPDVQHDSVQVVRPEITIEDIQSSDEKVLFYTGLPDYTTFKALFETLVLHGADKLNIDDGVFLDKQSSRKLRLVDEFLMVLMRLRLGLLVTDLEYRFKISSGRISRIFTAWITFMHQCMDKLVFLPSLEVLKDRVPNCFKKFSDTRIILDCTEIFIQTPSSLENKSQTYSHYKSHNTFKALVGISMTGAVVFVSKLYGGSASDVYITRECGVLDMLDKDDAVMVDKGFFHLKSDFCQRGVKMYCPPFKSSTQFSKEEVECTRRVASARIHVERKMEQIKNFRILQGVMPISLSGVADSIFFVCCALTNLLPPLVK